METFDVANLMFKDHLYLSTKEMDMILPIIIVRNRRNIWNRFVLDFISSHVILVNIRQSTVDPTWDIENKSILNLILSIYLSNGIDKSD